MFYVFEIFGKKYQASPYFFWNFWSFWGNFREIKVPHTWDSPKRKSLPGISILWWFKFLKIWRLILNLSMVTKSLKKIQKNLQIRQHKISLKITFFEPAILQQSQQQKSQTNRKLKLLQISAIFYRTLI